MVQQQSIQHNQQVIDCLELMTHQQVLVDQLQRVSRDHSVPQAGQQSDALFQLLGRRQSLIDQIIQIQNDLGMKMAGLKDELNGLESSERQQLDSLLKSIEQGLSDVMHRDDELSSFLAHDKPSNCGTESNDS